MVACHVCGFWNLDNSVFCGGCGEVLPRSRCPSCRSANPAANRFCNRCGARLKDTPPSNGATTLEAGQPARPAARKVPRQRFTRPSLPPLAPLVARLAVATGAARSALAGWSSGLLAVGALAVVLAQVGLYFSVELNAGAPLVYLLLLAFGAMLFTLGAFGLWTKRNSGGTIITDAELEACRASDLWGTFPGTIALLTGLLAMGVLLAMLAAGSDWGWTLLPWALAFAAFAVPFVPRLTLPDVSPLSWFRRYGTDLGIVLALTGLFLGLNLHDLQDWYYSAIGDEFLFFEHARHIVDAGVSRPFSQVGVYDKHPVLNSVFQAAVMWVFGADYFGWTLSEVLNAAVTIPGLYLLGHAVGGRKAAVVSAALFSFSHFVFGFSHVGYNNLSSLPVAVWSIGLFILGWRRGNPLLLYVAGIIAGFGFYTHYSGRAVMPIVLLFALAAGNPRRIPDLWPLALGFALTVAPTFALEREQVITRMFGQVLGGYSDVVTGPVGQRLLQNIELNLPAFNYNSTVHTYVYGPLLDPISSVLAVLGISFALANLHRPLVRLLLVWFCVAMVMTGVISPYPHVAITRLVFVLPPLVLLAGLLASELWHIAVARLPELPPLAGRAMASASLVLLLATVLALNLWQFWHVTPSVYPHTPEAVAIGAFRSQYCGGDVDGTVFVGRATGDGSLLTRVLTAFDPDNPLPLRLDYDDAAGNSKFSEPPQRCVVFVNPDYPGAQPLREELAQRYPDGRMLNFSNPSGTTSVGIFVPK